MKSVNRVKLAAGVVALSCFAALSWGVCTGAAQSPAAAPAGYELPYGANPFAPSNAKTTTGGFISQSEFIPAARCASCHRGVHAEWQESAHRNSFREPFYQTNVKHLIRDRRVAITRHCESCHNPAALFSGALSDNARMERPFDEEGVTCSVCHSIESVATRGIGSYALAPPAMLVREDGTRLRDAPDAEVRADLASHKRAVMRPLLKTPEFCAACHKAAVVPEMNGRKWLRSFSVYDEWQQSAMSDETVQPLNKRERQSCQTCHMPPSAETGYASHRWPGANTAVPAFYKWPKQIEATTELLQSQALSVDIFALRVGTEPSGETAAPLLPAKSSAANFAGATAGEKVTADVVVSNRNVGHSFPPEQRDIYEAWLEFEARDATGRVVFHSGAVSADGSLEASAHAYRTIPIDSSGNPITKHDIWNTRVGAFDRHIPAGRSDLGCFNFQIPADARFPLRLTARLNYRRFNSNYLKWVERETKGVTSPVTLMAETSATLGEGLRASTHAVATAATSPDLRKRWRSYGVALFDLQRYEEAAAAFERALGYAEKGTADEAASCADVAMALLRLERKGDSAATLARAEQYLARALEAAPGFPRARFFRGLVSVKRFRYTQALEDLEGLAREFPRDRQTWHQVAALYLVQRRDREALDAYEHILGIDPDDNEANLKLAGLYWRFRMTDRAKRAQDAFQSRHPDTVGETLRRNYLRARPEIYFTWPWREFGDNPIGTNP